MPRHDLYGPIHKGLRKALCELVVRVGRTDFAAPDQRRETLAALRRQLAVSAGHLRHEEAHIHPALEERAPGAALTLDADHAHHRAAFEALEAAMAAVEAAEAEAAREAGRELYLRFSQFVAADFAHMAEEEMVVQPLLHRLFSDEELIAIEGAIVGSLPPEENIALVRMMLPAMAAHERLGFMRFVKEAAPAEAFEAMMGFAARAALEPADYQALAAGLGRAA